MRLKTCSGGEAFSPIGEPVVLNLSLAQGSVDTERVAVQGLKSISREIKITPTHRILAQESVEIIYFGPYVAVVILELHDMSSRCGQVDGNTSHPFGTAVAETITDRRFERDYFG